MGNGIFAFKLKQLMQIKEKNKKFPMYGEVVHLILLFILQEMVSGVISFQHLAKVKKSLMHLNTRCFF